MYLQDIYDILVVEKRGIKDPIEKGKPFERMGHKALEPKSSKELMVVSCQNKKLVVNSKAHSSIWE